MTALTFGCVLCSELCRIQCSRVSTAILYPTTIVSRRLTFPLSRRSDRFCVCILLTRAFPLRSKCAHQLNILHAQLASSTDIFTSEPCANLAGVARINTLLPTGDVCEQQDNADKMTDFAKSPGVKVQDALVAAAIAYRKHPRNAEDIGGGLIPSISYCTKNPCNQEFVGVVNEQLPGINPRSSLSAPVYLVALY